MPQGPAHPAGPHGHGDRCGVQPRREAGGLRRGRRGGEGLGRHGRQGGLRPRSQPTGAWAGSSDSDTTTVRLWDWARGEVAVSLEGHTSSIWSVAFSPDGTTLATGSADETIKLWDVEARKERVTLKGHRNEALGLA